MALDQSRTWIVSGTHRGVFTLWDIRFGLRVKEWCHPSRSRINKLSNPNKAIGSHRLISSGGMSSSSMYSSSSKSILASVSGQTNEVALWDMETGECKEVWCVFNANNPGRSGALGNGNGPSDVMNHLYGNGLKVMCKFN